MEASRPDRIGPFVYHTHPPRLPPLRAGVAHGAAPVVICGGGPVGLAVALGLARFGIASCVLEADDTVCVGSRAICLSRRSLEILHRLGGLSAMLAKGLPWTVGRSFYGETEVFRFTMEHDPAQRFPPMINLQQYYIEQALLDAIDEVNRVRPGLVDLRWQTSLEALHPESDGVMLEVSTPLGAYRQRAEWLVACDGGQSTVRKALALPLVGTAYEGRYVIIDIELASPAPAERRAWFDPPWNRGGTVLMHKQPDDLWRVDYQLRHGESAEDALRPARVQHLVQAHLDGIGEGHRGWRPAWTSLYRAGAMTLERYRHGRCLFAGNAAHTLPIFGVRGLNSGFDDADNLSWKLASVIRGQGHDRLLDSYDFERRQAFHVNAESAMRSTEFMSPPSRGFDLLREAVLSLAAHQREIAKLINPRQTTAIAYQDSPLSSPGDTCAGGALPGAVLPDRALPAGGSLIDHLAADFTLLGLGVPVADLAAATGLPAATVDLDATVAAHCGAEEGAVVLVRPDGHVAARWRRPTPAEIIGAWRRARGFEENLS